MMFVMSISDSIAFPSKSLRIQSILYHNEKSHINSALTNLTRAVELARREELFDYVEIAFGDCSSLAIFRDDEIAERASRFERFGINTISYEYFNKNLGSAAGHNRLLERLSCSYVLILNPDTIVAPNLFSELMKPLSRDDVGMVEARQIPIEHPKDYDPITGETGWATTACALLPKSVVDIVGKFDSDTFFLYCDDVDYSWRVRLAGYRVIFQPSACVFHDKRLSDEGEWMAGAAEEHYSAEAALLLTYKYGRPDLTKSIYDDLVNNGSDLQKKAAREYARREQANSLPEPVKDAEKVAEFLGWSYTKHRF
jgi:GT2 family glycosyltransferase